MKDIREELRGANSRLDRLEAQQVQTNARLLQIEANGAQTNATLAQTNARLDNLIDLSGKRILGLDRRIRRVEKHVGL